MPGDETRTQPRLIAGRYQLLHELGRGGMGVVWLANDQLVDRQVAVKELRPSSGLSDVDRKMYTRRALQEARSAARIQHANAVTLYDVLPATAADDAVYLIMELINGPTLAQLIQGNGRLPVATVVSFGMQLLDVLEAAHKLGIVHRDIKPGNILIAAGDKLKLTDFGIAHNVGDPRLTISGAMGTQAYMAPELFRSEPISPAADVWSVGATLYNAAEGQAPFDRNSPGATLHAILYEDITVPNSPVLADAISGMLRRDPEQRATIPATRTELLTATRLVTGVPPEPVVSSGTPPSESEPSREDRFDNRPTRDSEPRSGIPGSSAQPDATVFTSMHNRYSLVLLRVCWAAGIIGSGVGCFVILISDGIAIGFATFVLWFILLAFGTMTFLRRITRHRTLVLDSRGLAVSVATFQHNQHTSAEARWDQVVRIGCFQRPGKPRLFLYAWISQGESKPARIVGLCPVGPPDFPVDKIRTAIQSYCPTVTVDALPDNSGG